MTFAIWLIVGIAAGALFVLAAYAIRSQTKPILFWGLVAAALVYVVFAVAGRAGASWITLELFGVATYGSIGFLGLRRSQWWLVTGWALHPAWDIALHYFGPGHVFAWAPYAIACMGWDPVVAATIACRILRPPRQQQAILARTLESGLRTETRDEARSRLWPSGRGSNSIDTY